MAIGNFKKNVIEKKWEAVYKVGKTQEIFYIRIESEYEAKRIAEEHGEEIGGVLESFRPMVNIIEKNK